MRYYPIAFDTKDKQALIVGGGKAAYQKLTSLLKSDFLIHIISRDFVPEIWQLYEESVGQKATMAFTVEERSLQRPLPEKLLESVDFLVIATDDLSLNRELAHRAAYARIPHLRCDEKQGGSCILQSIVQRGDLSIAIGTQGKSPLFSALLKEELENFLEQDLEERIALLGHLRDLLLKKKIAGISIKKELSPWMRADLKILRQHLQQMEACDEV